MLSSFWDIHMWDVTFMPCTFAPGEEPQYPCHKRLKGPQKLYGFCENKKIFANAENRTQFLLVQTVALPSYWLGYPGFLKQAYKLWSIEAKNVQYTSENWVEFESSLTKVICEKFDKIHYSRVEYGTRKQRRGGYISPRLPFAAVRPGIHVLL